MEQIQIKTEQLSRDVRELQNELMEKNSHLEHLLEKNRQILDKNIHMEQLLEKNNRMEQLLLLIAKKQGIQWDTGEAERQEEQEDLELSHP